MKQILVGLVLCYRLLFKAWVGPVCAYEPTCSEYALVALRRHGALRGGWLAGARLLRCRPWCAGGCDPVPENAPLASLPGLRLFSRLGL